MKTMNFAQLKLNKNQRVVVTAYHGKFSGKFNKISGGGSRLELLEVKEENETSFRNFKYFFDSDVIAVEVFNENHETDSSEASDIGPDKVISQLISSSSSSKSSSRSEISIKQQNQIKHTINKRSYFQQPDEKYAEAIADISKQFVIGISAEGCHNGR